MDECLDDQWCEHHSSETSNAKRTRIKKLGTFGGPVTAVSLPCERLCLYSQGSFLQRIVLSSSQQEDRHLVFDNGTNIHGIRHLFSLEEENREEVNYVLCTAVFGGRNIAIVSRVVPNHDAEKVQPMQTCMIRTTSTEVTDSKSLQLSDWICNVQWIPSSTNEKRWNLLVGLAHNTVELWSFAKVPVSPPSESSTSPLLLEATMRHVWTGFKRCLLYCLDFDIVNTSKIVIAAGTAMQDICVWEATINDAFTFSPSINNGIVRQQVPKDVCLLGHQGVIHKVKWISSMGNLSIQSQWPQLVSASDDRSVRLWKHQAPTEGTQQQLWTCIWIGWGHTARIWGLNVLHQPTQNSTTIISTGEDGTARLWNGQTGKQIGTLRGHACQCIWSVDTSSEGKLIATGGNDGTVALYDTSHVVVDNEQTPLVGHDHTNTNHQSLLLVPDDRPPVAPTANKNSELEKGSDFVHNGTKDIPQEHIVTKKHKKNQKQDTSQAVCGLRFYSANHVLVVTRTGSLFSADLSGKPGLTWIRWGSWSRSSMNLVSRDYDIDVDANNGCCVATHLSENKKEHQPLLVAVGTTKGEIIIATIPSPLLERHNADPSAHTTSVVSHRFVLTSPKEYRAVQGLAWVPDKGAERRPSSAFLLSFHVNTVLWWSAINPGKNSNSSLTSLSQPLCVLNLGTQAIPISFAFDEVHTMLFVGDTRGSLVMFHLKESHQSDCVETRQTNIKKSKATRVLSPSDALHSLHRKEHITGIAVASPRSQGERQSFLGQIRIFSVGNDGCINESYFDPAAGTLQRGLSIKASSALTGIRQVWVVPGRSFFAQSEIIVSGYYGNTFVLLNVSRGYELFRADTGGRQRQHDVFASFLEPTYAHATPAESLEKCPYASLAVVVRSKDGRNEIALHANQDCSSLQRCTAYEASLFKNHEYALGVGLHGESVYSACCFSFTLKSNKDCFAVLTGSEDCTSRVTFYTNGNIVASKQLPPQESCVRAVCSSSSVNNVHNTTETKFLLAVGGGKLTLQFFLVVHQKQGPGSSEKMSNSYCDDSVKLALDDIRIHFLGYGKVKEKASIDHRINAVKSIQLEGLQAAGLLHLVAAGDSEGNCHLYLVNLEYDGKRHSWQGLPLPQPQSLRRPILSIDIVKIQTRLLLLVGTTGGDIHLWDLPALASAEEWLLFQQNTEQQSNVVFPAMCIGTYHPHQMGTNSISASEFFVDSNKVLVYSGGDDQSLSLCELSIVFDENRSRLETANSSKLTIVRGASSSAIKEVSVLDKDHVMSVGYSQRLAIWRRLGNTPSGANEKQNKGLKLVWSASTSVGDVCCLASIRSREQPQDHIVAVCGASLELFSVSEVGYD